MFGTWHTMQTEAMINNTRPCEVGRRPQSKTGSYLTMDEKEENTGEYLHF